MDETNKSFWDIITKGAEPYVDEWVMMGNPLPMLAILTSYLYFVLRCGPKFMQNRPAYDLKTLLLVFNTFQVAANMYIFSNGKILLSTGIIEKGKCVMNDKYIKELLVSQHYWYWILKMTELLDTIFFVLRKKWNQVSFLHVYHHSMMFMMGWVVLKYEPTYSLAFLGLINSSVHIVMYGYYGLSAIPGMDKYLWWKKYITKMQLIQFALALVQITVNWYTTTCPTSYLLVTFAWSQLILFMYLFGKFYIQSYKAKRREENEKTTHKIKTAKDIQNNFSHTVPERNHDNMYDKSR